uniref:Uncharacterized protein n=1 Tax=Amphimedon queenslandica TaxID=400682 RepID=A0A1X7TN83_AMPQE
MFYLILMRISATSALVKITSVTTHQFLVNGGDGKTMYLNNYNTLLRNILLPLVTISILKVNVFVLNFFAVFRIGNKNIISVMEGGTLVLTIQQIGDEREGEAIRESKYNQLY